MKYFIALMMALAPASPAADGSGAEPWSTVVESEQGRYAVSVTQSTKKVEVKAVGATRAGAPYLRIRFQREQDRPYELHLKTVEKAGSPLLYTGRLEKNMGSFSGLELEFSFDKKTWKRLGASLKKLVP